LSLLALRTYHGLGVGQGGKGLVALLGQQKAFEVSPESLALGAAGEKIVEPRAA
jgi:hypothetical protein